jgi:hypothetical protein
MTPAHRRFGEWTSARMLAHATKTRPAVAAFREMVMATILNQNKLQTEWMQLWG